MDPIFNEKSNRKISKMQKKEQKIHKNGKTNKVCQSVLPKYPKLLEILQVKMERCCPKKFHVVCSCQNPTVADFASSLCARRVKSDKDILTREGAPVKKQNNTPKFNSTKKKIQIHGELA